MEHATVASNEPNETAAVDAPPPKASAAELSIHVALTLRDFATAPCRRYVASIDDPSAFWRLCAFFAAVDDGARRPLRLGAGRGDALTTDEKALVNLLASAVDGDDAAVETRLAWLVRPAGRQLARDALAKAAVAMRRGRARPAPFEAPGPPAVSPAPAIVPMA
ncbi:MAG: hypothetical protein ACFB00_00745 [Parvularculaceae bacterium]